MKKLETIRIDKYLSSMGITSRRNVANFLRFNKVLIGEKRVLESGERILPTDTITIAGKKLEKPQKIYIMLNKPKGYITTLSDEFGRKQVTSLLKIKERVFPIGRLDRDTHGLLLLTNDGELTNHLIHPRYHVGKIYRLTLKGLIPQSKLEQLEKGVHLDDGITQPAKIKSIRNTTNTIVDLEIFEGRKRQIRRMCEALKFDLIDLQRTQFGPLTLGNLKVGGYRELTKTEINILSRMQSNKKKPNKKQRS